MLFFNFSTYSERLVYINYILFIIVPYCFIAKLVWKNQKFSVLYYRIVLFVVFMALLVLIFPGSSVYFISGKDSTLLGGKSIFTIGIVRFFDRATTGEIMVFGVQAILFSHALFAMLSSDKDLIETSGGPWQRINQKVRRILLTSGVLMLLVAITAYCVFLKRAVSIGMEDFVYIKPGIFQWGNSMVTISKGFYMQATEVTQGQWKAVMKDNPSRMKVGDNFPVDQVSWEDTKEFIHRLNIKEKTNKYRLPTEAEWEYACRAGSDTDFANGNSHDAMAWTRSNSNSTHPVAEKKANNWGLYDMHGNVKEWCEDRYGNSPSVNVTDPAGISHSTARVVRGGSWGNSPWRCESGTRERENPNIRICTTGFRLVMTDVAPEKNEGKSNDNKNTLKWISRYKNGQKKIEGYYKENKRTGQWFWWQKNGKKLGEGTYTDGKETGQWFWCHKNGKKRYEQTYREGKKTGTRIGWHENGQKHTEENYRDNILTGKCFSWHENGQKESQGAYRKGERSGEWIWWSDTGVKKIEKTY